MHVQEMDVEHGQESGSLCRSLRLKVTDGVPRGAVNPGRLYLSIIFLASLAAHGRQAIIRRGSRDNPGSEHLDVRHNP